MALEFYAEADPDKELCAKITPLASVNPFASPFLVYEIATIIQDRSMELFNLGGVDQPNTGLGRFKAGFGSTMVKLEAAEFFLGSKLKKKVITVARSLRNNAVRFLQHEGL